MEEAQVVLSPSVPLKRRRVHVFMLACFVLPLFLLTFYTLSLISLPDRLGVILVALLAGCMGATAGLYILKGWETHMKRAVGKLVDHKCKQLGQVPQDQVHAFQAQMEKMRLGYEHQIDLLHSSVEKSKEQVRELNLEMDKKLEQMRVAYLEFEDLRKEYTALEEEYGRYQADAKGQLDHKESLIADYQKTIAEQREVIEKKQHYVGKLEGKVRDLMYEIRSLLQLEEEPTHKQPVYRPDSSKGKPFDLTLQLNRYLEMAENFTGADHLGGRFLNSGAHRYEIDLRPLFDKFSHEGSKTIFVYSPAEKRFLFFSENTRDKLGWGAEKMVKDFDSLVVSGGQQWFQALTQIKPGEHKVTPLTLKDKSGKDVHVDCYMGLTAKGPFAQTIIGLLV